MTKPWQRKRRRDARSDDGETSVTDSDEHAWWASRDQLEKTYVAPNTRAHAATATAAPGQTDLVNGTAAPEADEGEATGASFTDQFTTDSLFSWKQDVPKNGSTAHEVATPDGWWDNEDPYLVLGVPQTATWEEISTAHRRLAKLHHPDRLLRAAEDDRARSERRMRELNIAYSELRRRRGK